MPTVTKICLCMWGYYCNFVAVILVVAYSCYSYYPEDCYYKPFPNLASLDSNNSQSSTNTNQPPALGNPTDSSNTTTRQKTLTVCYKYRHCSIYH